MSLAPSQTLHNDTFHDLGRLFSQQLQVLPELPAFLCIILLPVLSQLEHVSNLLKDSDNIIVQVFLDVLNGGFHIVLGELAIARNGPSSPGICFLRYSWRATARVCSRMHYQLRKSTFDV